MVKVDLEFLRKDNTQCHVNLSNVYFAILYFENLFSLLDFLFLVKAFTVLRWPLASGQKVQGFFLSPLKAQECFRLASFLKEKKPSP